MLNMSSGSGWIKIHRKIKQKGYYKKSEYIHLWIHLLLEANHDEKEFMWNGELIKVLPGQLITGLRSLQSETGIKRSTVDRILKMFENETQIEQQITTKFRLITIKNWEEYQKVETQNETQTGHKWDTSGTQVGTNKNEKNYKNEKNIYTTLTQQIETLKNSYPPSMIKNFILYWDESDSKGTPRWKKEKTWEISKRLERWKRQQEEWEHTKSKKVITNEKPQQESKIIRINEGFQKVDYREEYFKKYGAYPLS